MTRVAPTPVAPGKNPPELNPRYRPSTPGREQEGDRADLPGVTPATDGRLGTTGTAA